MRNLFGKLVVCDGLIKDRKPRLVWVEDVEFERLTSWLKDYLICIEGSESSSYDDSDDERSGCYSSSGTFKHYREINPVDHSEYLMYDGDDLIGVYFKISKGYNDYDYFQFLFDGSLKQSFRIGYSASHSSNFVYVENVTLVKKGENGAPTSASEAHFYRSGMDTYI